jgi:hypothetical protein
MLIYEGVVMKPLDTTNHHCTFIQTSAILKMFYYLKHSVVFILVRGNIIP